MKKQITILLLMMALSSCILPAQRNYVVRAGGHYANFGIPTLLKSNTLAFRFTPDSTWIWPRPDKNGWSKITGIAWNNNHENSIRLVYMRMNDSIGVFGYYAYVNGISPQTNLLQKGIMDTLKIGRKYLCRIGWNRGKYFVKINGITDSVNINIAPTGLRTLQHPYIGGTYTINHDWHINLKFLGR